MTAAPAEGLQHFNSIKVRLELAYLLSYDKHDTLFQFHKGTIRTRVRSYHQVY